MYVGGYVRVGYVSGYARVGGIARPTRTHTRRYPYP